MDAFPRIVYTAGLRSSLSQQLGPTGVNKGQFTFLIIIYNVNRCQNCVPHCVLSRIITGFNFAWPSLVRDGYKAS